MTRSFTYDGSTELIGASELASFAFTQTAYRGEVGSGGFNFDDPASAAEIVGLKSFEMEESESSPSLIFSGAIDDRELGRGTFTAGADRAWGVNVVDENTYLDDILIRDADGGNRPAETDVARIAWLMGTPAMAGVSDAGISTAAPVQMDAADYRRRYARDVFNEAAELTGKNFYRRYGVMYYYDPTSTSIDLAGGSITNAGDEDGDTVFAPNRDARLTRAPARVYSGVSVGYDDGASVGVSNSATAAAFRRREIALDDAAAKTASVARQFGTQYLAAASTEEDVLPCPLTLPASKLGLFLPGQRVNTNFTHLGGAKAYRIRDVTWAPAPSDSEASPDHYLVLLTLVEPVKITRFGGRSGSGGTPTSPSPFVLIAVDMTKSFWQYDPFEDGPIQPSGYIRLDDIPHGIVNFEDIPPEAPGVYPSLVDRGWELRTLATPGLSTTTFRDRLLITLVNAYDGKVAFSGAIVTNSTTPPTPPTIRVLGPPFVYSDLSGSITEWGWTDPSQLAFDDAADLDGTLLAEITLELEGGYIDISGFHGGSSFGYTNSYQWNVSGSDALTLPRQFFLETGDTSDHGLALYAQLKDDPASYSPAPGQPVALTVLATADGVTADYVTAYPYRRGSLVVLVDRIDWSNDIVDTDPATGAFTFLVPPQDGDVIEVRYTAA